MSVPELERIRKDLVIVDPERVRIFFRFGKTESTAECGESRKCPTCGGEVICRAKRGHPGDHELFNRYVSSKDRQR